MSAIHSPASPYIPEGGLTKEAYDQKIIAVEHAHSYVYKNECAQKVIEIIKRPFLFIFGCVLSLIILIIIGIGALFNRDGWKAFYLKHLVFAAFTCNKSLQSLIDHKCSILGNGQIKTDLYEFEGEKYDMIKFEHHTSLEREFKNRWYIFVTGVASNYQVSFNKMKEIFDENTTDPYTGQREKNNVICANQNGVGRSTGNSKSIEDVKRSTKAAIDSLRKKGVEYTDMTLVGHSLGGGIASSVASDLADKNIGLICDRTFSTFEKAAKLFSKAPFPANALLGSLAKKVIPFNNHKTLRKVPVENFIAINNPNDSVITKDAQLKHGARIETTFEIHNESGLDTVSKAAPHHTLPHKPEIFDLALIYLRTHRKAREAKKRAETIQQAKKALTHVLKRRDPGFKKKRSGF